MEQTEDDEADKEVEGGDAEQVMKHKSGSRHTPLTLIQVPMMRQRTSRRRKPRLQVQSSSHHHVLVVSHPKVGLPLEVGEVQWQEAYLPSWPRRQHQRRSKSRLTELFFLFSRVMCAGGLAHALSEQRHLYALKGMYNFAQLLIQCMHLFTFASCFCCLLFTIVSTTLSSRGLAHSGARKTIYFAGQTLLLLLVRRIEFLKLSC